MKVLFVSSSDLRREGSEVFLRPEVRALARKNTVWCTFLESTPDEAAKTVDDFGARAFWRAGNGRTSWRQRHPSPRRLPVHRARRLVEIIRTRHKKRAILNARAVARAIRDRHLVSRLNIDVIHCHWLNVTATYATALSLLTDIPLHLTAHRYDIVAMNGVEQKSRAASGLRCISNSSLELLRERVGELAEAYAVIPLPVEDVPHSMDTRHCDGDQDTKWIAQVGRLDPIKRADLSIACLALLPNDYRLALIGSGPELARLERTAVAAGVQSRVRFFGQVARRDLTRTLEGLDPVALLAPSDGGGAGRQEGMPVAVLEAMAARIPVVSSLSGGLAELATHGAVRGHLNPTPEQLATEVGRLSLDMEFRRGQIDRARRHFEDHYSPEAVVPRIEVSLARAAGIVLPPVSFPE